MTHPATSSPTLGACQGGHRQPQAFLLCARALTLTSRLHVRTVTGLLWELRDRVYNVVPKSVSPGTCEAPARPRHSESRSGPSEIGQATWLLLLLLLKWENHCSII